MVRVYVVAGDPVARGRLRELLADQRDVEVVGDGDIPASAEISSEIEPDVIVWQVGQDLLDVRAQMAALAAARIPIVMLGPGSEMAGALAAGVRGYLGGDADPDRLAAAVHAVAAGLQVMDPRTAERSTEGDSQEPGRSEELTDRELEVLQLLAEGLANKEIARQLRISEHTVKFHLTAIMGKLGAHTRTEAVTRAARQGLITL